MCLVILVKIDGYGFTLLQRPSAPVSSTGQAMTRPPFTVSLIDSFSW